MSSGLMEEDNTMILQFALSSSFKLSNSDKNAKPSLPGIFKSRKITWGNSFVSERDCKKVNESSVEFLTITSAEKLLAEIIRSLMKLSISLSSMSKTLLKRASILIYEIDN